MDSSIENTMTISSADLLQGTEKQQREKVRSLGNHLKVCGEWNSDVQSIALTLIECYLTLPSKSSLKPYILSYIDFCDVRISGEAEDSFTANLAKKLTSFKSCQRRILSDSVCRLLDCKSLGPKVVSNLIPSILKFLAWSVKSAHEDSLKTEDSVEFNNSMTDIKVSIHTLNKFFQKVELKLNDSHVLKEIISICMSVIKQENALLDCQTSCAMTLPLVYRILYGECAVENLIRDLFESPTSEFRMTLSTMQTYLCLLTGLVGGLNTSDLLKPYKDTNILGFSTEKIFEAYDHVQEGTKSKYGLSRCLVVLTSKILSCTGTDLPDFRLMRKRLLQYVFNHFEDPVDAIRHQAKNVFENVIKIHMNLSRGTEELVDLAKDLISMDWHRKGKYTLLGILSLHLETIVFLDLCPDLPTSMLSALDETGMANYVSDLYDKLMVKHLNHVSLQQWHETWLDPVVNALANPELRQGVIVFVLPKVLQASKSGMKYIIPTLLTGNVQGDSLLVLVTCLKRARCLGYLPQTLNTVSWNDALPYKLLTQALEHSDSGLRVEAFGLLCFNPKTTEIIPKFDLDLLLEFLHNNLTSQSPAVRQDIVSVFRKLLMRMKESWVLFQKKKQGDSVEHYVKFVGDLYEGMLQNIYVGVSFTRRTSALNLLVAASMQLKEVNGLPTLDSVASAAHADNLFQILTDTFEENKTSALHLLLEIKNSKIGLDSMDRIVDVLELSKELVVTTRPQDCTTAAFLHKLLVQQPQLFDVFDSKLSNNVENRQFLLLNSILNELARQVELGEKDLIHASVNGPMYPVIHCVRYLFSDVKCAVLDSDIWRPVLDRAVDLSFRASAVVSPVISHASPEGNVPVSDLIGGDGDGDSLSTKRDLFPQQHYELKNTKIGKKHK